MGNVGQPAGQLLIFLLLMLCRGPKQLCHLKDITLQHGKIPFGGLPRIQVIASPVQLIEILLQLPHLPAYAPAVPCVKKDTDDTGQEDHYGVEQHQLPHQPVFLGREIGIIVAVLLHQGSALLHPSLPVRGILHQAHDLRIGKSRKLFTEQARHSRDLLPLHLLLPGDKPYISVQQDHCQQKRKCQCQQDSRTSSIVHRDTFHILSTRSRDRFIPAFPCRSFVSRRYLPPSKASPDPQDPPPDSRFP